MISMKTRCRKCNKTFDNRGILGLNKCPECISKSPYLGDDRAQLVRNLVKDNPNISASEVVGLTGLSRSEIVDYVRVEILEFTKDSPAYLRCEECGAEIKTGLYCRACKAKKS